jgi:hypothetical protein
VPVIPGEPMTPHLARVVAKAAAELRMRIQDPGDHPTPRSCQWEVISCIGPATGEPAASLRARANDTPPGGAEMAGRRDLENRRHAHGDWLAWRQLAAPAPARRQAATRTGRRLGGPRH